MPRAASSIAILAGVSLAACTPGTPAHDQPADARASSPDAAPDDASPPPPPDAALQPDAGVLYPDPDWQTGTPESVGLDSASLAAAAAAADKDNSYCLLVIRHGILVSENYFHGADATTQPFSWSTAKSYASTAIGIALGNGDLPGLDAPIADYVPSWQGTARASITLRNLLSMDSGLDWSIVRDYIELAELESDKSAFAVSASAQEAPGTRWVYNNSAVQVLEPYFRAATGQAIDTYAQAHLWSQIGQTATWEHDGAGHVTTFENVMSTCRDHARLGYLYLHGGKWKDQQVVPADYVAGAITPSQTMNMGYGRLFWLNDSGPTIDEFGTVSSSDIQPYAPTDLFAAHGFGGQFIDVIPSVDLVVVRFTPDPLTAAESLDITKVIEVLNSDTIGDAHKDILVPILAAVTGP